MGKATKTTVAPKVPPKAAKSTRSPKTPSGKNLVIVESPAKAKTINRYLGNDYVVKASMGHVRDLPKSDIGVDIEHDFTPTYEPLDIRRKVLAELKKLAKDAPMVYLATDLDREGEAIAWHLAESLKVAPERIRRVVFNEITQTAILNAFANTRKIDMNKVDAQQARRVLDRIVGYKISPLLWKKVAGGLSAGRVQSVAVKLIVDRERDIDAFEPEEYWKLGAVFTPDLAAAAKLTRQWTQLLAQRDEKGNPPTQETQQAFLGDLGAFRAELVKFNGERFKVGQPEQALLVAQALGLVIDRKEDYENPNAQKAARNGLRIHGHLDKPPTYRVRAIKQKETRSKPSAPFTTSTLQQTASVQMHFSASRTMRVAQQLYEGVELKGEGSVGLITYMRTDSTHLSSQAVQQVRQMIATRYGDAYLPEKPNFYAARERAQEAHEAIRPTDASRDPESLRSVLDESQWKLYDLIWRRFVACQMTAAVWKVTEADIVAETSEGLAEFKALGRTMAFDGFYRAMGKPRGGDQILPPLKENIPLAPLEISPTQHFTQPPPRYTEASLVKALEAEGIGRPSTYAAIIKTIQDRQYVEQQRRAFYPTDLGTVVTGKLEKFFTSVMDIRFTAHLEDELDRVEEAQTKWISVLQQFYGPFAENLERATEEMVHAKAEETPSDYTCEKCHSPMVYKFSKNGRYLACSGYPDCKNTYPVDKDGKKQEQVLVDIACPLCGEAMIKRRGKFGPFLSCQKYPECKGVVNLDPKGFVKLPSAPPLSVELPCTKCGAPLNLRRSKRGPWLSCSKYPKCRGRQGWKALEEDVQKKLELELMNHEKANPQPVIKNVEGDTIGEEYLPKPLNAPPESPDSGEE